MIFEGRDEWELSDPIYQTVIENTGIHHYSVVKISLNVNLFYLEICKRIEAEGLNIWERYICAFVSDIIGVLSTGKFKKVKLSLQPASLNNNDSLVITSITEIVEREHGGQKSYFYKCKNGETYSDSYNSEHEKITFSEKIIYSDYDK